MLSDPAETLHHPTGIAGVAHQWKSAHGSKCSSVDQETRRRPDANTPIPTPTQPACTHPGFGVSPSQGQAQHYQALDDLQQLLHDHSNALVAQEPTDGLEMRWPHEVAVGAVDVAVGDVERLEIRQHSFTETGPVIPDQTCNSLITVLCSITTNFKEKEEITPMLLIGETIAFLPMCSDTR